MKKENNGSSVIELIGPMRQQAWGWPAVVNFFLGGAGVGVFLFSYVVEITREGSYSLSPKIDFELLGLLLMVSGFLAVAAEAGRPWRGGYLYRGLANAWLSRETLIATIFGLGLGLERINIVFFSRALCVMAALAFMISQGFVLYQMRSIQAWNVPIVPVFFVSSGLASGAAIVLTTAAIEPLGAANFEYRLALVVVALNITVWSIYLHLLNSKILSKEPGRNINLDYRRKAVLLGHLVAMMFIVSFIMLPTLITFRFADILVSLSGLIILGSIFLQKAIIVIEVPQYEKLAIPV
jgi:DMSO reductase anchor subunit